MKNIKDNFQFFSLKKWPIFFYWLFIFVLITFLHSNHFLNNDDGIILNGAWNLINGRQLYVDFFTFIPPASFYLLFAWWKIFGVSFWAAQILANLIWFLGIFGIFKISQLVRPSIYNYFLPLFIALLSSWFWLINHNAFNFVCLIWASYFLILSFKKPTRIYFILAGLISGLSILFLQQKGLMFLAYVLLFLAFRVIKNFNWQNISNNLLYFISSLAPLLVLLFWPLNIIYHDLIEFPLFHYIAPNKTPLILWFFFLFFWLLFVFLLRQKKQTEIWLLLGLQLLLLLSCLPLPDLYHILLILFPLFVLSGFLLEFLWEEKNWPRIIAGLLFFLFLSQVFYSITKWGQVWQPFSMKSLEIVEKIRSECQSPYLYAGPFATALYFETRKLSATPFDMLITSHQTLEQFSLAKEVLAINRPDCAILLYPESLASLNRFGHNRDNEVENFIRNNYRLDYSYEDIFYFYKLKPYAD